MTSEVCFDINDHMIPLLPYQFQTSEAVQRYFKFYCLLLSSSIHIASLEPLSAQSSISSTFFSLSLSAEQSLPNHLAMLQLSSFKFLLNVQFCLNKIILLQPEKQDVASYDLIDKHPALVIFYYMFPEEILKCCRI